MGAEWHWTGTRIVSAQRVTEGESARGGQSTFVAGALDQVSGEWSQLPWLPGGVSDALNTGWPVTDGPLVLRFNRRDSKSRGLLFYRLMQQASNTGPQPLHTLLKPESDPYFT